ncbi:MAG: 2OG-Fe dioxygenase family protein [Gammaproteobacteria bacterium]|nr:2OG-Fe dioxygenase family protein [Gammaproteobacteria bacterium]
MVQALMDPERLRALTLLTDEGYVYLSAEQAQRALQLDRAALATLTQTWERLPRDTYLRDGGAYRARRHSCLIQELPGTITPQPPRAHWQPSTYNALHGGMLRWFEPLEPAVLEAQPFTALLVNLGVLFAELHPTPRWHIEVHQFRIDTAQGIGRPTPEGAHRDGVDCVALILVDRRRVVGGETRVFAASGSAGVRFTMHEPWSMLLLDDARVVHETTPIQPQGAERAGARDTLVLTYRAAGFQAPES